jgi:hypothetical protein
VLGGVEWECDCVCSSLLVRVGVGASGCGCDCGSCVGGDGQRSEVTRTGRPWGGTGDGDDDGGGSGRGSGSPGSSRRPSFSVAFQSIQVERRCDQA